MITIKDLKKRFGETVACDIPELTINDGDILGLVGNNGAGKTHSTEKLTHSTAKIY